MLRKTARRRVAEVNREAQTSGIRVVQGGLVCQFSSAALPISATLRPSVVLSLLRVLLPKPPCCGRGRPLGCGITGSWRFTANCGHVKHSAKAPAQRPRVPGHFLLVGMTGTGSAASSACDMPRTVSPQRTSLPSTAACSSTTARWARTSSAPTSPPRTSAASRSRGATTTWCSRGPTSSSAIHESFLAVGCDVVETCTFQIDAAPAARVGLEDKVARDQRRRGAPRARRVRQVRDARQAALRRRLDRARRACSRRAAIRCSRRSPSPSSAENYYEQAKYLVEGGVDVLLDRDVAGHPRGEGGDRRHSSGCSPRSADASPIQAQVTLDTSGRMLLGTDIASAMTTLEALGVDVIGLNCSTGPEHMREPIRYLGEHASRPDVVHSERGTAAQHRHRRRGLSARAGADGRDARRVRRASSACASSAAAAARRPSISRRSSMRRGAAKDGRNAQRRNAASPGTHRGSHVPRASLGHARDHASTRIRTPLLDRRARERAGLAQGEAAAPRRRLRGHLERRARAGRVGRARARRLRRASPSARDEAEQMAKVVQAAVDERRDADHDRLDRGRRHRGARSSTIPGRAIINSINMENGRKRIDQRRAAREEARRGARRAHDRRDRHGEDARAEARGRAQDLRHRRRRVRSRAGGSDLRRAHVHARDRRRGVDRLGATRRSRASV